MWTVHNKNRPKLKYEYLLVSPLFSATSTGPTFESDSRESSFKVTDEFELMQSLCEVLFQQKRYPELQRVAFSSLGSPIFNKNAEIMKEVEFLCLISGR